MVIDPRANIPVDANIAKAEIPVAATAYGAANDAEYQGYAPGALVLVTFAGALNSSTGLYEGSYLFRSATASDTNVPRVDFATLPGIATAKKGKK